MPFQAMPLLGAEFHAPPIAVAGLVLIAELHPPRLAGHRLGRSDVRLELDGIAAGVRGGVDEGMRIAEASIMRLPHFSHDETGRAGADLVLADTDLVCAGHDHSAAMLPACSGKVCRRA